MITNEMKAKIFALYLGSPFQVEYVSVTDGTEKTLKHDCLTVFDLYIHNPEKDKYHELKLILKPLSEITDDDLTEIAKMYGGIRAKLDDLHLQVIDANNMVPKWFYLKGDIPHTLVDFLRSKSYALPYIGIDLFESSLAIPKQ